MKAKHAICTLVCLLFVGVSFGQIPPTMSYQGVLTDAGGNIVADNTYQLRFRLYETPMGGTALWDETQSVVVENGLFNAILGINTPIDLPFIQQYWLGTTIDGGTELAPRTQLTSSAYSFNARMVAGGPNVFPSDGNVGIGIPEPQHSLHVGGMTRFNVRPDSYIDVSTPGGWPGVIALTPGEHRRDIVFDDPDPGSGYKGGMRLLTSKTHEAGGAENGITINEDGEVGIGTSFPDAKLTVEGMVHSRSGGIKFPDGTVQSTAGGGGGGSAWTRDAANGEVELSANSDKVGIGTNSPQQKLHVAGIARFDVRSDAHIDVSTPGGWPGVIALTPGDHRRDIVFDDPDPSSGYKGGMRLLTSKTNAGGGAQNGITINEDGQVGIATSFPSSKLHVNGDFQVGTDSKKIRMFTAGAGEDIASTNTLHLNYANNQAVSIGEGGASNLNVSGSVGLGTTSPDGKLDIDFGSTGSMLAGTPGASGPGWIFFAPNGNRRDILAENGGIGIGTSPTSGSAFVDLFVNEDGKVGISTKSPTNILTVVRNSGTDPIADAWTTYSSRRWKTNIQTMTGALETVKRLRGVRFDWKKDGKHDVGLIAEEVGEIIPEVVAFEDNGLDAKSVDYARLVSVLIEAVKEQQEEIDELKRTLESMSSATTSMR